ncbi:phospholipase D family protein [Bdellovibrio sp. 22V]|uniref:phospholipase D family protein n=1 Tax=Bdellovibrio sp. 22V TaxID=3044166 RepID=UPI00254398EF|nr:phospholipase D family protein [Bdellovibrio sp. 22V]WII73957.1 phospholipase D family protein [Bdellovibrio sp. 22V]
MTLTDTDSTPLGKRLLPRLAEHPGQSGFYALAEGPEALVARIASVREAEKSLDLQYYIWHGDQSGQLLMYEVLQAADRGVRVRLLLDDLHGSGFDDPLKVLDSHPNIEVRMFNPFAYRKWKIFNVNRFSQLNRRMHNKAFIADNQVGIIGGRNIGDEYFTASKEMNFGDFDTWCLGPVVKELSASFDLYWNHELAYSISTLNKDQPDFTLKQLRERLQTELTHLESSPYYAALQNTHLLKAFKHGHIPLTWAKSDLLYDSPDKVDPDKKAPPHLASQIQQLLGVVQKEAILISPYFIPGEKGLEQIKEGLKRGVKYTILTNSLASNDVGTVFAGYKKYREDLLRAGVQLYELKARNTTRKRKGSWSPGSVSGLHGKVYVLDADKVLVGSLNLDPRSMDLNSEVGVIIYSSDMAKQFALELHEHLAEISYKLSWDEKKGKILWTTLEDGKEKQFDSEPEVSIWRRMGVGFLSLFIPESQL